jgi:uncharacterized protein YkwD
MKINRIPGRVLLPLAAGVIFAATGSCAMMDAPPPVARFVIRAPDLTHPASESVPPHAAPEDPVKKAVFERINADRATCDLPPLAWDEAASRVADMFTAAQVREGTRGHFLLDGVPPYARTGLAGIFGMGAENSVSWTTTGANFRDSALHLALQGQAEMFGEKPPDDGHRRTILDPHATHVGVGWAQGGNQFRLAEEFQTRHLETLTLQQVALDPATVLFKGRTVAGQVVRFVTIAVEPLPLPLSRAEVKARTRYAYPEARLALVPEGNKSMQVVGCSTENALHLGPGNDFSFRVTPGQAGLWVIILHTSDGRDRPRPGGLAVLEVAKAP